MSQQDLLSGEKLFGIEVEEWVLPEEDILAVSDDMHDFLDNYVERHGNKAHRLRTLMNALHSNGLLNLEYTSNKTLTASDTFQQKAGNCLAFTNLFVALAREVGLKAIYQQVDVPPSWRRGGDFVVLNQHINVLVKNPHDPDYMVDFNLPDYSGNYDTEPVSDKTAFAQYYSNRAVEHLESGEYREAFTYLKKALLTDSRQAAIWINLGALYSRQGHYDYAEAAYLYALKADSRDRTAHNNLSKLYLSQGRIELSKAHAGKARYYRDANPYYYFWLARQAYTDQKYKQSLEHLSKAITKKDDEHLFYYLKGLNHYQLGDKQQAKRDFAKAEERSQLEYLRKRYRSKLDLLASN
ncbi:tetratricopeptide repeat protein [Porticoccus sp. W117]|uniref:tetratricopeptide repeat protein n=1 Tax=Porticoccus sp. W117 TaxID=3054777 RepID=UPI002593861E|nr:tetratricopeptide repeat protein [Porticoccus sp. W117]